MASRDKAHAVPVRLFPTGTAYIPGIRSIERLVPADVAERLLAFTPPAFTADAPSGHVLAADPVTDMRDIEEHPEFRAPPVTAAPSEGGTADG